MATSFAASSLTAGGLSSSLELEIKGLYSLKADDSFATNLTILPGVTSAELNEMKGGIAFITVEIAADKAKKLALLLETSEKMAAYGLTVEDSSSNKIAATATPKNVAPKAATPVKKP